MSGPFVIEGSTIMREGESRDFTVIWQDFTAISASTSSAANLSSLSVEGYVNGSSQTASLFSGSPAVSGNTLTLPTFTVPQGTGGTIIILEAHMKSSSQLYKTGIIIDVLKPGAER